MTTDQAFEQMINTRGIYHTLDIPQSTTGALRYQLKHQHRGISIDLKIKLLQKAGYKIAQEMRWHPPHKK